MKKILNEQLNISRSNPLKARKYDYKYFNYPLHLHVEYELIYVEHGDGQCIIGDNIISFKDQTLILFGSSLPHCMQSPQENRKDNDLHVNGVIIQFEKDFMHYAISNYIQFMQIQKILNLSSRGIRFDIGRHPDLQEKIKKMPGSEGIDQIILFLSVFKELTQIKKYELAASPNYSITLAGIKDDKIDKILSYLNSRYTKNPTLEEVAAYAAMNPSAFCRYFKAKTGKTFKEYILDLKLGYACRLLADDSMNIFQIGLECGFDSLSYFNRVFKKQKGTTPTEYKKRLIEE